LTFVGFLSDDVQKNNHLIDTSQRPAYLLLMIQQWLNMVLNLVVMVMAAILTTLAVRLHSSSGFTGASLVTLMNFGESLTGIVMWYTRLETSIGAISRLRTFNKTVTPEDREEEDVVPPEQWPQHGFIDFKGVSASYEYVTIFIRVGLPSDQLMITNSKEAQTNGTSNLALREINLKINAGEKVAICGRTGSGKSSLIALLLKLLDPRPETASNVTIDNTPLHRIARPALRQRILAMPQEAVFLTDGSSFQANLDPFGISTSEECEAVLSAVGMWQFVQERGGLDSGMTASNLSAGQRQLLSLGRTLLRRRIRARHLGVTSESGESGILLLDEVSSNVDHETERVMQEILSTEFKNYTVVAVSHRLDMIMDFDRVVVMDMGEVVEVGNPIALAEDEHSRFGDLLKAGAK
jgi:ABC-type multidrug transport system fused ATPase/permease subunit